MPLLPTILTVPFGHWLVHFTRFNLRPPRGEHRDAQRADGPAPTKSSIRVPLAESALAVPLAERYSERRGG